MKSRLLLSVLLAGAFGAGLPAQTAPAAPAPETAPAAPSTPATPGGNADATAGNPGTPGNGRTRRNFNPADLQARILTSLREQMGVTDDSEWSLISTRITAVLDLRRTQLMSTLAGFGNFMGGGNRGNRGGGNSPEQEALRSALDDNLPDAEITSRLARLREVRKQNEATLDKARDDLRAVLTVRQEAVAVMAGVLN
jgi:hypothetical protein